MPASLVIVNPHAARLGDPSVRAAVAAALDRVLRSRDGLVPRVVVSESAAATREVVADAIRSGVAAVVGVGGDGTLKEIATGLQGSGVPLGIVPGGTGNILAGVVGVPGSLLAAAEALADAVPRTIDMGDVDVELADAPPGAGPVRMSFMVGVGMGFDARVMASTPPGLKRRMGRLAYFAQAARLATRISVVPYRVTVDGERYEIDASIALVANLAELVPGRIGPRLPVIPDDGLLDVFVLGARGPLAAVRGLLEHLGRTETGARAATIRLRARHVRLESMPPEPCQVDGDHLGPGALEAIVRPGALTVLAGSPGRNAERDPLHRESPTRRLR